MAAIFSLPINRVHAMPRATAPSILLIFRRKNFGTLGRCLILRKFLAKRFRASIRTNQRSIVETFDEITLLFLRYQFHNTYTACFSQPASISSYIFLKNSYRRKRKRERKNFFLNAKNVKPKRHHWETPEYRAGKKTTRHRAAAQNAANNAE